MGLLACADVVVVVVAVVVVVFNTTLLCMLRDVPRSNATSDNNIISEPLGNLDLEFEEEEELVDSSTEEVVEVVRSLKFKLLRLLFPCVLLR